MRAGDPEQGQGIVQDALALVGAGGRGAVENPHEHHGAGGYGDILGHERDRTHDVEAAGHAVEQKRQQHAAHQGNHNLPEGINAGDPQGFPEVAGAGLVEQPVVVVPAHKFLLARGQDAHVRKGDAHQVDDRIVHKQQEEQQRGLHAEQVLHALHALNQQHHAVEEHDDAHQQQDDGDVHQRAHGRDGNVALAGQVEGARLWDFKGEGRQGALRRSRRHGGGNLRAVAGIVQHQLPLLIRQGGQSVYRQGARRFHRELQAAVLAGARPPQLHALGEFHAVIQGNGGFLGND